MMAFFAECAALTGFKMTNPERSGQPTRSAMAARKPAQRRKSLTREELSSLFASELSKPYVH